MYAKWLASEMDFKVCVCMGGGGMEHWKALPATMVDRQEKISNSKQ